MGAWGRLFNELLSDLRVSFDGQQLLARRGAVEAGAADRPVRARPGRRGGHRDAPAGRPHARLRAEHDPERARDRGPAARLRQLDLRAQPLERDPGRGGAEPRRCDRLPLRHPAALLRAQGAPARPGAAARLRPLRAAAGGRGRDRVGGRARDRARVVRGLLAARRRHRRPLLRARLDRRRGAAREDARRLLRDPDSRAPSVRADELRGRAAQRAHARARARARPARDARPGSRPAERPRAADARRDGVRLRRGAHVRDAAGARGRPARACSTC